MYTLYYSTIFEQEHLRNYLLSANVAQRNYKHFGLFLLECFCSHFEFNLLIPVTFQVSCRTQYLLKRPINKKIKNKKRLSWVILVGILWAPLAPPTHPPILLGICC